ncbi:MAG: LLM class F420-dependent oxidoreductase [Nakamurella sp.]
MDLRIFTEPQLGASHADLLAVARATRDGGFSAFFRSDHVLAMGDRSGLPGPSESFVNLGAIAAEVADIRLGTLVATATVRHPSMTAIATAQIDDISNGRMELGIGTGWYEAEHTAYGLPFGASFGERFDRLTEQLEIITGLWATPIGETFDHAGANYTLAGAPGLPKPVQTDQQGRPRVPIIIGGGGPKKTPALAARFADEFNIGFRDLTFSSDQLARVRQACEDAGRDPNSLVYSVAHPVCVGSDEAEFARRAAAIGREPADLRASSPFAGTVNEVLDKMGTWAEVGVQRSYLQVLDLADLDHIALLSAEVLPAVRDS